MTADGGAADVVDYWHAVEMFSAQSVARIDPSKGVHGAQDKDGRQPWTPGHKATDRRLDKGQTWRHQVFCGLYEVEAVSDVLSDLVGKERDTSERRSRDKAGVASFFVTAEGLAVPGSLTDLGDDDLRGAGSDAGDLVQAGDGRQDRRVGSGAGVGAGGAVVVDALRFGDRLDQLIDAGGEALPARTSPAPRTDPARPERATATSRASWARSPPPQPRPTPSSDTATDA